MTISFSSSASPSARSVRASEALPSRRRSPPSLARSSRISSSARSPASSVLLFQVRSASLSVPETTYLRNAFIRSANGSSFASGQAAAITCQVRRP